MAREEKMETKSFPMPPSDVKEPPDLEKSVDRLADLLAETSEVRELIRAAVDLKNDPDLIRISLGIKDLKAAEGDNKQPMLETLLCEREALPAVQQFREAETGQDPRYDHQIEVVKALFTRTALRLSTTMGVKFTDFAH